MNVVRIVLVLLIVVAVAVLFVRFLVPFVRRVVDPPSAPTVVPGDVVADAGPSGFPIAFRHGYEPADVDALFDRVYTLTATPSGRAEALVAVRTARFHLSRHGGYEPVFVDDRMDALADALANGRELPPRPGSR